MAHRVYFEKGAQALTMTPHQRGAVVRVASGTYRIVDTRYSEDTAEHEVVAAGTAATIDATSTTLSAAAGRTAEDRRAVSLASSAGFVVGSQYILEAPNGQTEDVRVSAVPDGTTIRTRHEIRGQYPTGSTLRGVQVTATFPADPAADEANLDAEAWLVIWTFPGMPPIRESVHLERGEEAQLATLDDLLELDGTLSRTGGNRADASDCLSRAHKDLRVDLAMAGVLECDLMAGPLGRDAVCYRAAHLALAGSEDAADERKAAGYQARYLEIRTNLVIGAKKPGVVSVAKDTAQEQTANPGQRFRSFGTRRLTT